MSMAEFGWVALVLATIALSIAGILLYQFLLRRRKSRRNSRTIDPVGADIALAVLSGDAFYHGSVKFASDYSNKERHVNSRQSLAEMMAAATKI